MRPIYDVASSLGLSSDDLLPFGHHLAKLSHPTLERLRTTAPKGKLVLVSAMTPTKYGEGKTTTTIGLVQGLHRRGHRAIAALREPSLGPIMGAKGGGTGGGRATLEPSARINMHCTGDLHAITAANNLLSALIDHAWHFRGAGPTFKSVSWRRCLDSNDRMLRHAVIGLGGSANGPPREDGFDITAASQVMATLCMANGIDDLKARLSRLIVGIDTEGKPITAGDLKAVGAMSALLHDAVLPNLAQTQEGVPAFVHGGPFANIAHGCNSVAATRCALALGDIVCTEAGFAFDLGGEKFLDLKCRQAGVWPSLVVLVVTARALRFHGGDEPGLGSIEKGFANVERHLKSIASFGLPAVVAINTFTQDSEEELSLIERKCKALGVACERAEGFAKGGAGMERLADTLASLASQSAPQPKHPYELSAPADEKIRAVARTIYGAKDIELTAEAKKGLKQAAEFGYGQLPVCMAKTHMSLSDDPAKVGAPTDFTLTVREIRVSAGAGFLLALTGDIMTMPGLPKVPAAYHLDLRADATVVGAG